MDALRLAPRKALEMYFCRYAALPLLAVVLAAQQPNFYSLEKEAALGRQLALELLLHSMTRRSTSTSSVSDSGSPGTRGTLGCRSISA